MTVQASDPPEGLRLVADDVWTQGGLERVQPNRLDPALRAVLALASAGDAYQVYRRLGMAWNAVAPAPLEHLPLLIQFDWGEGARADAARTWLDDLRDNGTEVEIDEAFLSDGAPTHVTARLQLGASREGPWIQRAASEARHHIARLLSSEAVVRVELPGAALAFNEDAQAEVGLPPRGTGRAAAPGGAGVVIGIIDDGCALAHPNFLLAGSAGGAPTSRILWLWDQGRSDATGGWAPATGFSRGLQLDQATIDDALAGLHRHGVVDEDAVYAQLGLDRTETATHGTHVMDIAAGNGRALMSTPGVAPDADLIFVQLPREAVRSGGFALDAAIVEGIRYIFKQASSLAGDPAVVVNISYGGYIGPHDGTSFVESALDAELAARENRAAVVAAGNGFAADCHAAGKLRPGQTRKLRWIVKPEDPTENTLEVWYRGATELPLTLVAPDGTLLGPVGFNQGAMNLVAGGALLGTVDHQQDVQPSGSHRIRIILNPTGLGDAKANTSLAPAGLWELRLSNGGSERVDIEAWIERDTAGRAGRARRRQSHFHPGDAECWGTLASYATGRLAIGVGAYNTATGQVCRYSACGPTRDGRQKPDVLAPAEEDAVGRGILSAAARSARPPRMSGTSAAAPVVAGMIALLFEKAAASGSKLSAQQVKQKICDGADQARRAKGARKLQPNAYIAADGRRKVKQSKPAIWAGLIGNGRIDWPETKKQP